jgi:hypothetical protein
MAFKGTIRHEQKDITYKGGRVGKNKTYRDNDSFDYHLIGVDLDDYKEGRSSRQ